VKYKRRENIFIDLMIKEFEKSVSRISKSVERRNVIEKLDFFICCFEGKNY